VKSFLESCFLRLRKETCKAIGGEDVVKVLGMGLSRLATRWTTPPLFLQLYFRRRLKMSQIVSNSRIMLGKAFCGNGFIHLNIAEIHEEDIGGQKT